jgi:Lrp/AsnC family transcriptional regulator of ectoine degradation
MAGVRLDAIDLRILDAIQRDGRITKLKLAEMVGLSPTPCWMRLRKLQEVTLRTHRQADFDRFERVVRDLPEIVACWSVGGGVDYLLKVMTRDIDAYQRLVDGLLEREIGIDRYFTYIVIKTVKEQTVLPLAKLLPIEALGQS